MKEMMKDSGIQWIGEIPATWKTNKIKYLSVLKGRIGWQGLTSEEYQDEGAYLITGTDFLNGRINWDTCVKIPESRWEEARDIQIENGDLLITKDGTVGKIALVDDLPYKTSLNSGVLRISTDENYDRAFLYWVLQSSVFWDWFKYKNAGNSTIIHLYQKDFGEFVYAFPTIKHQQAIATFLDSTCSQIDDIITNLEHQVDLLKEYKKSLITETVTKGLDKHAKLKDSGVAWIGLIPEGWEVIPLKYVTACNERVLPESTNYDYVFRYVDISSVSEQEGIKNFQEYTFDNAPSRARRIVHTGDVIISTVRTYLKAIALIEDDSDVIVSTGFAVITPLEKIESRYLYYYCLSDGFLQEIDKYSYGVSYPAINANFLISIDALTPPISEQQSIANFLDTRCAEIDSIIKGKEEQIEQQKEYKKSLIYEYVTGKKRVKEVY